MVAVAIFDDSKEGHVYVMGWDKHSTVECIQKSVASKKMTYISDYSQRMPFLERAVAMMDGSGDD